MPSVVPSWSELAACEADKPLAWWVSSVFVLDSLPTVGIIGLTGM